MAKRIPTRLTPTQQGRRFGTQVGGAFALLGSIAWWRGHPTSASILGGLGVVLAFAGVLIPAYLGPVERAWMTLAHTISRVTSPVMMAVVYFVVITPIGLLRRTLGRNPLLHEARNETFWKPRPRVGRRAANMERQF